MTTIIGGSSPSITFSDGTTQTSGYGSGTSQFVSSQMPTGSVLQVVQGTSTTSFSTASATPSDIGLSATITPKFSTSKILVSVCITQMNTNANYATGGTVSLVYGSTTLFTFDSFIAYQTDPTNTDNYVGGTATDYLHSPATTSAITYKIQASKNTGGGNFRIMPAASSQCSITLWEIAG